MVERKMATIRRIESIEPIDGQVKKILASGDKKEEIIESLAKWGQRYAEGIYRLPVGGAETPAQALDNIEQAKIAAGELVEQLDRMALAIKSCQ